MKDYFRPNKTVETFSGLVWPMDTPNKSIVQIVISDLATYNIYVRLLCRLQLLLREIYVRIKDKDCIKN